MMVIRQTVVVNILLVCALFHCHAPGTLAADKRQQTEARAHELLQLSAKRNFKDHSDALQIAKRALILFQDLDNKPGIALALGQVARCLHAQSNLFEASAIYQQALQLWREENDTARQAETLNMLGFVESVKGDWDSAISYYMQAQSLINDEGEQELERQTAAGLAYLFNENGLPEQALVYYQRALELAKQTPGQLDDDRITMLIGDTYLLLGDPAAAETHLQRAFASLKSGEALMAAECQESLARLEISRENFDAALQYLLPAINVYVEAKNWKQAARARAVIGQVYELQDEFTRARTNYLQASAEFRRISDRVSDAAVSFALGRLELKGDNYDVAEEFLKQSLENTELIRSTTTGRKLTEAFSASVHARYAAYIECLMRKHTLKPSAGFDVLAFQASELARARSLAELLHDTQTNLLHGVESKLAAREKSLRQLLRAKEDYRIELLAKQSSKADLDEVETSLIQLREEYKQVREQIRLQNPTFDQISQPTTYSLQQIQLSVIEDGRTVLLEYFIGADASYVWLVTSNSLVAHEIPKEAVITDEVNKLYTLLSNKPSPNNDELVRVGAEELGQKILGPVMEQISGRRVIVVADGALNYVPFQVLSSGNKPLIDDAEIINAPSASILGQLRAELAKRKPAENTLAAFGDAVFASNYAERRDSQSGQQVVTKQDASVVTPALRDIAVGGDSFKPDDIQPLFYVPMELRNIRELAGPTAFVATEFEATRQRLQETDLSKYSILHLATHGVFDPMRPEKSGFVLSLVDRDGKDQDGFILMKDVYRLHAPVDLVVLSACRTGLGKEVQGEGLIGLTRGFMHAGALSVASTLWRVDDQATAELMKYFYANMLQKRMTPAAALREAQKTIRQDPRWTSPHFWAAFTLQGEYKQRISPPVQPNSAFKLVIITGLLLIICLIVYTIFLRRLRRLHG
jgi:CHAT domain-containing protein